MRSTAAVPVSASMRRMPEATLPSEVITNGPISPVWVTWVPPQSSFENSSIWTMRTVSPYFSPKSATAPSDFASSRGSTRVVTSRLSRTALLAISSI